MVLTDRPTSCCSSSQTGSSWPDPPRTEQSALHVQLSDPTSLVVAASLGPFRLEADPFPPSCSPVAPCSSRPLRPCAAADLGRP